ncbi:AraC family ligand binding domain-containing protein [Escherichia coli]
MKNQGREFVCHPGDICCSARRDSSLGHYAEAREWYHQWVYFRPRAYWHEWLNWPSIFPVRVLRRMKRTSHISATCLGK